MYVQFWEQGLGIKGTQMYGSDGERYKLWWSGGSEGNSGVGVMIMKYGKKI